VSPPQARIAKPHRPMTQSEVRAECDAIAAEFDGWTAKRGGNLLWHAQSGKGDEAHGDSPAELRQQIRDAIWMGANA
jgi:hypothetical protein